MSADMIKVTPELQAQRAADEQRQAYAEHQRLVAQTQQMNAAGMTIEQMRRNVEQADAWEREARALTAERARVKVEQEREAARVKSEQERQEQEAHAATFKARQLANWIAGGLGTEREFEREWSSIRLALFAAGKGESAELTDEEYRARKRREMAYR